MPLGKLFGGRAKDEKATQQVVAEPQPEANTRYVPRKSWSMSDRRRGSNDINPAEQPPRLSMGSSAKAFDIREFGRYPSRDSIDSNSGRASVDRRVNP